MKMQQRWVSRRQVCASVLMGAVHLSGVADPPDTGQSGTSYRLLPLGFEIGSLTVQSPPSDDTAEAHLLLAMQRHRTHSQIAQIKAQSSDPLPLFWRCAGLDETLYPEQAQRILEAVVDTEAVVVALKRRYNRRRPSVVLPQIHPVIPVPPYASYPSGHATQSVVIANLMARLAPKAARRLTVLAMQVGRNREIAGLHYPSDTNAGFSLGGELSEIFLRS